MEQKHRLVILTISGYIHDDQMTIEDVGDAFDTPEGQNSLKKIISDHKCTKSAARGLIQTWNPIWAVFGRTC